MKIEPMNAMELDEVRRWAEQRTNPDDESTTVGETYLRLLATVADARRAAEAERDEAREQAEHWKTCASARWKELMEIVGMNPESDNSPYDAARRVLTALREQRDDARRAALEEASRRLNDEAGRIMDDPEDDFEHAEVFEAAAEMVRDLLDDAACKERSGSGKVVTGRGVRKGARPCPACALLDDAPSEAEGAEAVRRLGIDVPAWAETVRAKVAGACSCTITRHERQENHACPVHFPAGAR